MLLKAAFAISFCFFVPFASAQDVRKNQWPTTCPNIDAEQTYTCEVQRSGGNYLLSDEVTSFTLKLKRSQKTNALKIWLSHSNFLNTNLEVLFRLDGEYHPGNIFRSKPAFQYNSLAWCMDQKFILSHMARFYPTGALENYTKNWKIETQADGSLDLEEIHLQRKTDDPQGYIRIQSWSHCVKTVQD
ncbi:MAG: hypothetical protein AB1540_10895 [Bdellovibrionota bacterium]